MEAVQRSIKSINTFIQIEVELKDGKFKVLSEEYTSDPEYHRGKHYKNTF